MMTNIFDSLKDYFTKNPAEGKLRSHEALSRYTSFHCGGKADFFCDVNTIKGLQKIVIFCYKNTQPLHILGFGTDLLVKDQGIKGAVIRLTGKPFYIFDKIDELTYKVGSRTSITKLVNFTAKLGLSGCEWLSGIPASLGGALALNAGAYGHRIDEIVQSITVILPDGTLKTFRKEDLSFAYRKGPFDNGEIILYSVLKFTPANKNEIRKIAESIFQERLNKIPKGYSAGCVFKNPDPPHITAGSLIDQSGLKGANVQDAFVSEKHANFIINRQNATSENVLELIRQIQDKVKKVKGIDLNLEIKIWG